MAKYLNPKTDVTFKNPLDNAHAEYNTKDNAVYDLSGRLSAPRKGVNITGCERLS